MLLTRSGGDWGVGRAVRDERERERWDSRRSSVDDATVIALKLKSQRHPDTDDS